MIALEPVSAKIYFDSEFFIDNIVESDNRIKNNGISFFGANQRIICFSVFNDCYKLFLRLFIIIATGLANDKILNVLFIIISLN